MPPTLPSEQRWKALEQGMREACKKAQEYAQKMSDLIRRLAPQWWVPAQLIKLAISALEKLIPAIVRIARMVDELLRGFFFPFIAFRTAHNWSTKVKDPVNQVAGNISDNKLTVDDEWQGKAAQAYRGAVVAQTEAIGETDKIINDLQLRLWIICAAMLAFYISIGVILTQWVTGLAATGVADATGVGALAGIPAALGLTAVTSGAIVAAIGAFTVLVGAEAQTYTTLRNRISHSQKFSGNGSWPKATTSAFRDGSLADGDDTDWHLK